MPRCCGSCHSPGWTHLAGGRHRSRARRRAAVHRAAKHRRRGRRCRAPPARRGGATLAAVQQAASAAGLVFGVDLAARDTATVGGMASTNAGGLRTVRYGNMGEQVLGLDVALPDGSVLRRHSRVRADNTGYNLPALFVGAEGTLGVIAALDLRLHPTPSHRVTALCGFADLGALVEAARTFRDLDGIAALELIDGRPVS
ncbi:FAD binding domain protein [Mycobacterium xenopi 3993]|nr:FAD binding domain protein [Mycobacterium xenopi 3993]